MGDTNLTQFIQNSDGKVATTEDIQINGGPLASSISKAYDEDVHIKCTGYSNKTILENLQYIDKCGKNIEIRIPFVPDFNDNQIDKIASFISKLKNIIKVRVLPYHNYAGSKYKSLNMKNTLPHLLPDESEIKKATDILTSYGIKVI